MQAEQDELVYSQTSPSLLSLLFSLAISFILINSLRWKTFIFLFSWLKIQVPTFSIRLPKISTLQIRNLTRALATNVGRDKAIKSVAYSILLYAPSSARHNELKVLAREMASCRLLMRQVNHPGRFRACSKLSKLSIADPLERFARVVETISYTIYGVIEAVAWLADHGVLLTIDGGYCWTISNWFWALGLVADITCQIQTMSRQYKHLSNREILVLLGICLDFIAVFNSLPVAFLWAGQLTQRQSTFCFLIAAIIAFYKCL